MDRFPVDVQRIIYGFDPSYHRDVFTDLMEEFRSLCRRDCCVRDLFDSLEDPESRLCRRQQFYLKPLVRWALQIPDGAFGEAVALYDGLEVEQNVKESLYYMIKMNIPSDVSFYRSILILQRALQMKCLLHYLQAEAA